MKRLLMIMMISLMALSASALDLFSKTPSEMSIQIKDAQLRETPTFLGKKTVSLGYGDRVKVEKKEGVWVQVQTADGQSGWLHESALTKKEINIGSGGEDVNTGASGDELALAGKGFNSDVEASFKEKTNIDFTWVDRMEAINIPEDERIEFLEIGQVVPAEGGAQ